MKSRGFIKALDNELLFTMKMDVSYSISSIKQIAPFLYAIEGSCWIDPSLAAVSFTIEYDKSNDIVVFKSSCRMCFCSYEMYNKYYLNIRYSNSENYTHFLCIPWLRIHDQNNGVAIPQLVEDIFSRIPNVIVF